MQRLDDWRLGCTLGYWRLRGTQIACPRPVGGQQAGSMHSFMCNKPLCLNRLVEALPSPCCCSLEPILAERGLLPSSACDALLEQATPVSCVVGGPGRGVACMQVQPRIVLCRLH